MADIGYRERRGFETLRIWTFDWFAIQLHFLNPDHLGIMSLRLFGKVPERDDGNSLFSSPI